MTGRTLKKCSCDSQDISAINNLRLLDRRPNWQYLIEFASLTSFILQLLQLQNIEATIWNSRK